MTTWQTELSQAITCPEILLEKLQLDKKIYLEAARKAGSLFGLRVTESFVNRMEKNNPHDPLLLQILPLHAELNEKTNFSADPLKEKKYNPVKGLLHKYPSRALITLTGHCAVNCRFCFRREFPYQDNNPGTQGWKEIFEYIISKPDINEIILSGGDPLSAPDRVLESFGKKLLLLKQIKTLRIHTRLPVVLPQRLTDQFVTWLKNFPLRKILVLHINHPNEINTEIISALKDIRESNIILLNQSVLLKNINHTPEVLIKLSEKLLDAGILPYYLHLLDKVRGAGHFEVSEHCARKIIKKLQENLPGYLVPRLVREVPGQRHKTMIK